jgi:hypothetical protein
MTTDKTQTENVIYDFYDEKEIKNSKPILYKTGVMWPHKNGKGFTIDSVHGRHVVFLREPKTENENQSEEN